jgi:mono/diheme cytochrome c family protein
MKKLLILLFLGGWIFACSNSGNNTNSHEAADGAKLYKQYCIVCHGVDGKLGLNGSKDLTISTLTEAERIVQVTEGKNAMTPFKQVLSPEEIKAVVAYTFTLK